MGRPVAEWAVAGCAAAVAGAATATIEPAARARAAKGANTVRRMGTPSARVSGYGERLRCGVLPCFRDTRVRPGRPGLAPSLSRVLSPRATGSDRAVLTADGLRASLSVLRPFAARLLSVYLTVGLDQRLTRHPRRGHMNVRAISRKRLCTLAATTAAAIGAAALIGSGLASAQGTPSHGSGADGIPNLGLVEQRIEGYYGDPGATGVASAKSDYAYQTKGIAAQARLYLQSRLSHRHGLRGKPALVLDIDDTSLLTYGYEISQGFGYTPASNLAYLRTHTLPAVFGMKNLADWAAGHGSTVIWVTGRRSSQRALTKRTLAAVGYSSPLYAAHLFLKPTSNPPGYLTCGTSCSTIQYKSLTRKHITNAGYDILADMGDQYSDLIGGYADHTVKLPNPMYYIP